MPKIKTRKSTAKRFRLTAKGRVARSHANKGHLLTSKTRKRKRGLRRGALVAAVDEPRIRRQLALR
jgi:large subunit ribosomal protein L35